MNRTGRMLFRHVSSLPFLSKTKAPWMCPVCTPPRYIALPPYLLVTGPVSS
jgi:hypothetical protein